MAGLVTVTQQTDIRHLSVTDRHHLPVCDVTFTSQTGDVKVSVRKLSMNGSVGNSHSTDRYQTCL